MTTYKKNYMEVCLTTGDGIQHLRLYGYLKRLDIPIKNETVTNTENQFGMVIVICDSDALVALKKREDLFETISVMDGEDVRWGLYKTMKNENIVNQIKDFMFSFDFSDPKKSIETMLHKANETSIELFRKNKSFIDDYVNVNFLTYEEKLKDLESMITYFEYLERYEDCALLVEIKEKVKKSHFKKLWLNG
jgi:hypothetical protein